MNMREKMAAIGKETVAIVKQGFYTNQKGQTISIKEEVAQAVKGTVLYSPEEGEVLLQQLPQKKHDSTIITASNTTTLAAAQELQKEGYNNVLVLNFASAKNPGGGFLNGSQAQEESLARSSALYETLLTKPKMYAHNKQVKSGLYSDYMIYSPNVPVFRQDNGALLDEPYPLSFITSPAVNVHFIQTAKESVSQAEIYAVMKKRIEKILAVGVANGHEAIVLGAFGCGVFKNRPNEVARCFKEVLSDNATFYHHYKRIVFAVYDKTAGQPTYKAFEFTCKHIKK